MEEQIIKVLDDDFKLVPGVNLTNEQILQLSTERLLALYKMHYRSGRNPYYDSWIDEPTDTRMWTNWNVARDMIRCELSRREHIPVKQTRRKKHRRRR